MTSEPDGRQLIAGASALLEQGERIDRISRPLTLVSLIGLLAGLGVGLGILLTGGLFLVALGGVVEAYLAMRVAFEAAVFQRLLGEDKRRAIDVRAVDAALLKLGLLSPRRSGASIEERFARARLLFTMQAAALILQIAVIFAGVGMAATR